MNTLEYLQLTSNDLNSLKDYTQFTGVFIYGNATNGIMFRKFKFGTERFGVKNDKFHGEYKVWNLDGTLTIYQLFKDGKMIKNYLEENKK